MDDERNPGAAPPVTLATVDGRPAAPVEPPAHPRKGTHRHGKMPPSQKKHRACRGKEAWKPSARDLKIIRTCRAAGMTPEAVAGIIGVSPTTLRKRAHEAVMNGANEANAKVVSKLFDKCMKGDTIALLFWCKSRLGWTEKSRVEHTGADGGAIQLEKVEAAANAFTARILAMAQRFEPAPAVNDGELAGTSTEPAEVNSNGA